tara:strand:- start:110 stop:484 length:375 start_codon:yes stop_codon:yes gene_type:complete
MKMCYIPVSIGELFDKYTILQIKQERITNKDKLDMVEKELSYLKELIDNYSIETELIDELKHINERLWVIEDNIRVKEQQQQFDDDFISLARQVYITNDKRSETKNKINFIMKSELIDIKSYYS